MSTIPASELVSVNSSIISAGGSGLDLSGLILTNSARPPIGAVLALGSAAAVAAYFGAGSAEASIAAIYFAGFDNSSRKPGRILFSQYNQVDVAAWLRGGNVSGLTLTQLKALSGSLTVTIDGVVKTAASVVLSAATSFSNAASMIATALSCAPATVTYDSQSGGFIITSGTTGGTSTISVASGTLAASLALTTATGAVTSQGAAAATPVGAMTAILTQTGNFATFMTSFDPDGGSGNTLKLAFANWTAAQNKRIAYVCWDTDAAPTASANASTCLGQLLAATQANGTVLIYGPDYTIAAFICGTAASIDFTRTNGRITFAYKAQGELVPTVTTQAAYDNLIANGYNCYAAFATASTQFTDFQPGFITGQYKWADSFINQIWLNNQFQLSILTLLSNMNAVPYDTAGYAMLRAACMDPIKAGLLFGMFAPGSVMSNCRGYPVGLISTI